mgnify:CR=1 FL=1
MMLARVSVCESVCVEGEGEGRGGNERCTCVKEKRSDREQERADGYTQWSHLSTHLTQQRLFRLKIFEPFPIVVQSLLKKL